MLKQITSSCGATTIILKTQQLVQWNHTCGCHADWRKHQEVDDSKAPLPGTSASRSSEVMGWVVLPLEWMVFGYHFWINPFEALQVTTCFLAQISSSAIRCSFNTRFRTRFRRVLVQIPREVPEGSGADTSWGSGGLWRYLLRPRRVLCGSGGFQRRYRVRFRRVPVQIPCEVPEGSSANTLWGSGSFRCRYLVGF